MPTRAGIALGSNLGDSMGQIVAARDMLCALMPQGTAHAQAPLYQSAPLDCPEGSPDFLNTVIEIPFAGTPHELLASAREIEAKLGRDKHYAKNAPRSIDIDILYFGDERLDDDALTIPHPQMTRRRFVLQPLADIRPDLVLPGDRLSVSQHLHHLDSAQAPLTLLHASW